MLQNNKIEDIVTKIQKSYLFLACLGLVLSIFVFLEFFDKYIVKDGSKLVVAFVIYFFLYFGLMLKKQWIIPLIQISAAFGFFWGLLYFMQPAGTIDNFLGKIISVLFILFYGYQINFFSKTEVKDFFRSKGSVLFCLI